MKRTLQINLTFDDNFEGNLVVDMDAIQNGTNRIEYVQEWEDNPMKKIEVLQALHELIDEYMK